VCAPSFTFTTPLLYRLASCRNDVVFAVVLCQVRSLTDRSNPLYAERRLEQWLMYKVVDKWGSEPATQETEKKSSAIEW
jgi:hypothetical protein